MLAARLYSIALLRNQRAHQQRATVRSRSIAGAGTFARPFACVDAWPRKAKTAIEVRAAFHGSCLHAEAGPGKWSSLHYTVLFPHALSYTCVHAPDAFRERLKEDVWHAEAAAMSHETGHLWCCM